MPKYDWGKIQLDYDSGMSQSQIIAKYGMSSRSLYVAAQRGDFKSRSRSDAGILNRAMNPRSAESKARHADNIRQTVSAKVAAGEWHTSLARNMHNDYNGVDLHGSWEVAYAKFLDSRKIPWLRCKERFAYTFNGVVRHYTPDFYLPNTNEYVEIKGYKTAKDLAKWTQFPKDKTLRVLMKADLIALGAI